MKKFSKMLAAAVVSVFVLGLVNFSQSDVKEDQTFAQFQQWAVSHQNMVAGEKLQAAVDLKNSFRKQFRDKLSRFGKNPLGSKPRPIDLYARGRDLSKEESSNVDKRIKGLGTGDVLPKSDERYVFMDGINKKYGILGKGVELAIVKGDLYKSKNAEIVDIARDGKVYLSETLANRYFNSYKGGSEAWQNIVEGVVKTNLRHLEAHLENPTLKEKEINTLEIKGESCDSYDVILFNWAEAGKDAMDGKNGWEAQNKKVSEFSGKDAVQIAAEVKGEPKIAYQYLVTNSILNGNIGVLIDSLRAHAAGKREFHAKVEIAGNTKQERDDLERQIRDQLVFETVNIDGQNVPLLDKIKLEFVEVKKEAGETFLGNISKEVSDLKGKGIAFSVVLDSQINEADEDVKKLIGQGVVLGGLAAGEQLTLGYEIPWSVLSLMTYKKSIEGKQGEIFRVKLVTPAEIGKMFMEALQDYRNIKVTEIKA